MENVQKLKHHDIDAYTERVRNGLCFICEMLADKNPHHIVYQDDFAVAFMNKYTRLYGYVLVSPTKHREHVVPYEKQQTAAISTRQGILDISENEMEALADQIRRAMKG